MKSNNIVAVGTRVKVVAKDNHWRFKEGVVDSHTMVSWTIEPVYRVIVSWKTVGKRDKKTVTYLLRDEFICT